MKLDAAEIVRLANRLAATDAKRNPFVRLERRAPMNEATMPEASSLFYGLTEKAARPAVCSRAMQSRSPTT